jgi:hypothetical protein
MGEMRIAPPDCRHNDSQLSCVGTG